MLGTTPVIALLVFCTAVLLTLKRPRIRIPFTPRSIQVDYGLAPLLCVVILLTLQPSNAPILVGGIFGFSGLKPISVIVFIMSLAYICVYLDTTGFYEYVSLRFVKASGGSGKRLFIYFFLLTSLLTMFTSNDVVILTMTYMVLSICNYAGVDPIPFLIAQFFAANIASIGLYVGNPTNIVIADTFGISFIEFARWMLLPSISATLTCLLMLLLIFMRRIPSKLKIPEINPRNALRDKNGSILGLAVLAFMLLLLSLPTEYFNASPHTITLTCASIVFIYDVVLDRERIPMIFKRITWKISTFLIGLFIIVEGLSISGWADLLASTILSPLKSPLVSVIGISFISSLVASLMNNHPMTIFFTKILQKCVNPADRKGLGLIFALVIGSNLGANYALTEALAGLMWSKILSDKDVKISFLEFSKYGLITMIPVTIVAGLPLSTALQ